MGRDFRFRINVKGSNYDEKNEYVIGHDDCLYIPEMRNGWMFRTGVLEPMYLMQLFRLLWKNWLSLPNPRLSDDSFSCLLKRADNVSVQLDDMFGISNRLKGNLKAISVLK